MFFEIELFGDSKVDSALKRDATRPISRSGTFYTVRLGNQPAPNQPRFGIALRNQREKNITTTFVRTDARVFRDDNVTAGTGGSGVGSIGGVNTVPAHRYGR